MQIKTHIIKSPGSKAYEVTIGKVGRYYKVPFLNSLGNLGWKNYTEDEWRRNADKIIKDFNDNFFQLHLKF